MENNIKINILVIDNNKEFNDNITAILQQYKFNVTQIFDEKDVLESIEKIHKGIDLILLNIDFDDHTTAQIFNFIAQHTHSKVILLSSEDIEIKREEYFSQGILDYHLTTKKIEYIVNDIADTISSLNMNKNETILVIDKSHETCNIMKKLLSARNYNVVTVSTTKEGLSKLKDIDLSLLILDMEMADINALDLLEGLRDMYLLNNFVVLGLSENKNPSVVRDTLKSGAKDFLLKPFSYEGFLLKVEILVHSARSRKTNQKQKQEIENNLKISKELLDSSIGAMFIFDNDICTKCNNEAVDLLGYKSKKAILNHHIFDIFPDVTEQHKKYLTDDSVEHYFEDTIKSKNSNVYDVQIKEKNISIDNKVVKIVSVIDVTAVKRDEKIVSQQTKMASMGEMIGNIAHQWRQPLNAISVAAGGIKLNYEFEMEDREETIAELDNIIENTKFLSSTIESFQNFLKVNKVTTKFNIESTCKKTIAVINANLKLNDIIIIEDYHSTALVDGVENELMQVFLNIINNAADILKTSPISEMKKYIKISIKEDKDTIFISFQDTGNGIPKNIINKIFEPYFTTKHQSQGTGLGLYMTHQIIEKMGGNIKVENKYFEFENNRYYGANFLISFPISK